VLVAGIFVAVSEVQTRLATTEGAWLVPGTWFLFFAYAAVPVALFWLLDRTGAVNDTSVFAAILIGFGYQRIISGGNQTIKAPGEVSALWTPFVAYADKVTKTAVERGARNQRRLAEKIIVEIMKDPARYKELEELAYARTSDTAAVKKSLEEIDQAPGSGADDKLEKKTWYLYGLLLAVPDINYLLRSKEIVSSSFYWLQIKRYEQIIPIALALLVLAGAVVYSIATSKRDFREIGIQYHVWRLGKTNSSSIDQYRSRRELVGLMQQKPALRQQSTDQLIYLAQRPGLPMERVDLVLQTLLETHPRSPDNELARRLPQALRGSSLDGRTRVHDALVFLSEPCTRKLGPELKDWKPTERDSSTTLEERISAWNLYWARTCSSK
jgi:hypothetical protein